MLLSYLITGVVLLIMLSVIVLIHEFGHFLVAKRLGVKVEEFGFGFPPRIWGKKVGETIYSINLLPIGGFVKLFGEDEAGAGRVEIPSSKKQDTNNSQIPNAQMKRAFFARSVGQRASIVVAGVVMNTLLAIGIFYIFLFMSHFTTSLPLLGNPRFFFVQKTYTSSTSIIVDEIESGSPASKIGMVAPLQLLTINGKKLTTTDQVSSLVNANKGKVITIRWQELQSQKTITASVTPRVHPPVGQGALGVGFGSYAIPTVILTYKTFPEKLFSGVIHPLNLLSYTVEVFGKLIAISFQQRSLNPISQGVSGPVGVGSAVGQQLQLPTLREKIMGLLNLSGLISISIAFFNILPIPALDGGRLFFIVIEAVTRRKVNQKIEGYAHAIGMLLLLALIVFATYNDILRLAAK